VSEKLAVTADATRIINEGNELGLELFAAVRHVRPAHRIGSPKLVGVGFGKGQTGPIFGFREVLEYLVASDDATKSDGRALLALKQILFDAGARDHRSWPLRSRQTQTQRNPWAWLMRRVFLVDVFECPDSGGRMKWLCACTEEMTDDFYSGGGPLFHLGGS
jgi:hypothetical protein